MPSISLCMIVKNEQDLLPNCLSSIKPIADEIIIADTGSSDKTMEIAKKHGARAFSCNWADDFSKARNESIKHAAKEWILVLDADEIIDSNGLKKMKEALSSNKGFLGYRLIQKTYYRGEVVSVRGICRLFKNDKRISFVYPIHETVKESIKKLGRIGKTGIIIQHYPNINRKKTEYYLNLLKAKKEKFPESNVDKEIQLEKMNSKKFIFS